MSHLFYVFFVYGEFSLLNDKMTNSLWARCPILDSWPHLLHLGAEKIPGTWWWDLCWAPVCSPHTAGPWLGQAGYAHVGRPSACLAPDLG